MTFIKGSTCELRVLDWEDEYQVERFTRYVNLGLTTQHLFTGSIPMRACDYAARWEQEAKQGAVQFGIWIPDLQGACEHSLVGKCYECGVAMVGTCGLYTHRDIYRSWEFRILIFDPQAIGKGIGTEATKLTVDYGFKRLNAHRIWLGVNAENEGAVRCYQKAGFKQEGILRDDIFVFGRYVNAYRMAILEKEWLGIAL